MYFLERSSDMTFFTSALAKIDHNSVVALGCFDGVHIGHSKIISSAVTAAKERSLTSVVWSFQAPPKNILSGKPWNCCCKKYGN
jgi:FAD synthase